MRDGGPGLSLNDDIDIKLISGFVFDPCLWLGTRWPNLRFSLPLAICDFLCDDKGLRLI